ncbi:phytoene synthase [Corynebacterium sp. HMSC05H05]|uniref:phytoene/squalene synthase family protein n=1 Tax=unclassified Corynebacterium TaxID=2624378 RepID=UPI0008A4B20B|nr:MULTISPECIES: phytoene/squalene synthase family protein [unclassified Corynebacterium]OFT56685.1 phytoene synthase [Corynebacterium sp. HMSC05H05]OHR18292.1 phytoene synthase [Corynebacterium sp. HMSC034A01]
MADKAAAQVIAQYSTSFSLAVRTLPRPERTHIRNLYAMVRIADEIVDGTTTQANECPETALDLYEEQVLHAPAHRFHTDPVLHAWARTFRECRLNPDHVKAFFASMRADLTQTTFTQKELDTYIYGSAEVIGLMCLDIFMRGRDTPYRRELEEGARALGSAFQKVNFLRDLGEDSRALGRAYFDAPLDDALKSTLTSQITDELDRAHKSIPLLPPAARGGVAAAEALFRELNARIAATPAAELQTTRVSVPNHIKFALTAKALANARKQ